MAWVDDRLWCHPKILAVPASSRWVYVAAVTYSAGFSTGGILELGQQHAIGCTPPLRKRLIDVGLFDDLGAGRIRVHDWDEHNSKRDERRKKDRERKRAQRGTPSAGQTADSPQDKTDKRADISADKTADRRTLKEVKEVTEVKERTSTNSKAVTRPATPPKPKNGPGELTHIKDLINESLKESAA